MQAVFYVLYAAQLYWMLRRIGSFGPLTAIAFPIPLAFFHVVFFRFHVPRAAGEGRDLEGPQHPDAGGGMQTVGPELPVAGTILLNVAAWLVIHLGVSYLSSRLPLGLFREDGRLYRTRRWEKGGRFYQDVFRIRAWKGLLPDGAALFKSGFRKKRLGLPDDAVPWDVREGNLSGRAVSLAGLRPRAPFLPVESVVRGGVDDPLRGGYKCPVHPRTALQQAPVPGRACAKGDLYSEAVNLLPYLRQSSFASARPFMPAGGSPPPGETHWPCIQKFARPGRVKPRFFIRVFRVGRNPS